MQEHIAAVGDYAAQLVTWAEARVIATVSSPENAERAHAGDSVLAEFTSLLDVRT